MAAKVDVAVGGAGIGVFTGVAVDRTGRAVEDDKVAGGGNGVGAGGWVGDVSTAAGAATDSSTGVGVATAGSVAGGRDVLVGSI
jgi:hypothetical protein